LSTEAQNLLKSVGKTKIKKKKLENSESSDNEEESEEMSVEETEKEDDDDEMIMLDRPYYIRHYPLNADGYKSIEKSRHTLGHKLDG